MRRVLFGLLAFTLVAFAYSNRCESRLFTLKSAPGIKIIEFLDNLADECSLTLLLKDKFAKRKVYSKLSRLNIKNATLEELLDLILTENDLSYELEGNILKVKYLTTRTFHIDYVISKRRGETVTDASVDVGATQTGMTTKAGISKGKGSGGRGRDVNKITSVEEFDFWQNIQDEIYRLLNRPEDEYQAPEPIINPNAGLVTVTATAKQIARVENYIQTIEDRLHKEVLIDVSILAVFYNKNLTTGIDWSRFSLLLNGGYTNEGSFSPTTPLATFQGVGVGGNFKEIEFTSTATTIINSSLHLSAIIDFLQKNGKVVTLSNPKILTLNNQPAIISIGDTINYNVPTSITITSNSNLGEKAYTPSSIFVGILLNITPEITQRDEVILRINPSISELRNPEDLNKNTPSGFREIAPDTKEKKLSAVVKVKDGSTLILGGLISNTRNFMVNGVPILKDIPLFGNLFKSVKKEDQRFELVFVIKPKIIDSNGFDLSLKDFGYEKLNVH